MKPASGVAKNGSSPTARSVLRRWWVIEFGLGRPRTAEEWAARERRDRQGAGHSAGDTLTGPAWLRWLGLLLLSGAFVAALGWYGWWLMAALLSSTEGLVDLLPWAPLMGGVWCGLVGLLMIGVWLYQRRQ